MGVVALFAAVALGTGCARTIEGTPAASPRTLAPNVSAEVARLPPGGPISRGGCLAADTFAAVDCNQPHELEAFHFTALPVDFPQRYPTPDTLLPRFEPQCRAELPGYLGSADADASRLREFVYWPSQPGWNAGQRWVLCAVVEIGPDDRPIARTGSLQGVLRDGLGRFQTCSATPPSQGNLQVVPCTEPHRGEAVPGVLVLGDPTSPPISAAQANARADPHCHAKINAYLGSPTGRATVRYSWRYPLPESWANGYTSAVCYAETDTPVTGSLSAH
ncbi:MAG TPA: septum formation family protein [Pseudonocardiaceae bacterium]|jgi:hypothetical protein